MKSDILLPDKYIDSLAKAKDILFAEGCKEIYLFGSLVTGKIKPSSDIDIGIRGLDPGKFYSVYSRLEDEIETKIDLVDFDEDEGFYGFLRGIGELEKVG